MQDAFGHAQAKIKICNRNAQTRKNRKNNCDENDRGYSSPEMHATASGPHDGQSNRGACGDVRMMMTKWNDDAMDDGVSANEMKKQTGNDLNGVKIGERTTSAAE